jgi:putative DNA primase/helicase
VQAKLKASEAATGKWHGILTRLGVDGRFLTGKHGECPMCGGKDRFRFDDKQGRGTWICSQACGSGDGFMLLQRLNGWTFSVAAKEVEAIVGTVLAGRVIDEQSPERRIAAIRAIWDETEAVTINDPVWLYLNARTGIQIIPKNIRYHPALPYHEDGTVDYHPALVARIDGADGRGVGIHRIYLNERGGKASVSTPKKFLTVKGHSGAAVRLGRAGEYLGIAEGIETALAASVRFGVVTWSALSAGLMEQWIPPAGVSKVIIFGDNDESYTGQASAYLLAKRLKHSGLCAEVCIPKIAGKDWADMVSEG